MKYVASEGFGGRDPDEDVAVNMSLRELPRVVAWTSGLNTADLKRQCEDACQYANENVIILTSKNEGI